MGSGTDIVDDEVVSGADELGFEEWREAISKAFVPLDARPLSGRGNGFSGGLHTRTLGDLHLSEVEGQHLRVARTSATIRVADPGVIKVALQLSGSSTVTQRGREVALGPGDIVVYDTSEPYDLRFAESFDLLVAVMPRSALRITETEVREGTARRIGSSSGVGALLCPVLHSLHAEATGAAEVSTSLVSDAVADLVSAALRGAAPDGIVGAGETVLISARTYIDAHLADVDLSPASVAAYHHVSLRYLQKLFAGDGHTVSGYIRARRLERSRQDLRDPAQLHRSIGSICAAHGLVDAAHFSRLFKSTYGVSPREYRER